MDKYVIAPPSGSTNNSVGASDRKWKEGYFEKLPGINEYLAESTGYGIVSGCEPSISGLTVTVAAGVVHLADGTRKELTSSTVTLDAADTTNPRIDLVYITSAGTVAKVTGTAAASPSAPALPANGISVAQVSVEANATTGTLTDNRGLLSVSSGITPDQFDGTDTQKLQAAFDYLAKTGGTIIINRPYTITSNITIRHAGYVSGENTPIYVVGGKEGVITVDGAIFAGAYNMAGGVCFQNIAFYGSDKTSDKLLAADDSLRKLYFSNCRFRNFLSMFTQTNLIDTWFFDSSNFFDFGGTVFPCDDDDHSVVHLIITKCYFATGVTAIEFDCDGVITTSISECIMEHYTTSAIKIGTKIKSLYIEKNYFEGNSVSIDLSNMTDLQTVNHVDIKNNYIYYGGTQKGIVLPSSTLITAAQMNSGGKMVVLEQNVINAATSDIYSNAVCFNTIPAAENSIYIYIPNVDKTSAVYPYLYRYDWDSVLIYFDVEGTEAAGTEILVKDWSELQDITKHNSAVLDNTDMYAVVKRAKSACIAYLSNADYKLRVKLLEAPSTAYGGYISLHWK